MAYGLLRITCWATVGRCLCGASRQCVGLLRVLTGFPWLAAQYVLGNGGTVLMLCICFMAVTSAASAEMMAVGSLFTYDIYKARNTFVS